MFGSKVKKALIAIPLMASLASCNVDKQQAIELEKRHTNSVASLTQAIQDDALLDDWQRRFKTLGAEVTTNDQWFELGTELSLIAESATIATIFYDEYGAQVQDYRVAFRTVHNWIEELRGFRRNAHSIQNYTEFNGAIFTTVQRVDRITKMIDVLETLPISSKKYLNSEISKSLEVVRAVDNRLQEHQQDTSNIDEIRSRKVGSQAKSWLTQVLDHV